MKQPFKTTGPNGKPVMAQQLSVGDTTQAGDWYIVLGHLKAEWHSAEPNMKIREFHHPHVRIVQNLDVK